MRTIKFRMWKDEEMIDGDSLAFEEYLPITELLSQDGIMEYTGLKDKGGTEVYDGDILKCTSELWTNWGKTAIKTGKYRTEYYIVRWVQEAWGTEKIRKDEKKEATKGLDVTLRFSKVIGNIHENPKLLEG